ncbi:MAG: energy transducer TonB [Verrucomicrobiota bacterium]
MKDSQLHALNIGALALWLSVTGFAAVAIWVPSAIPKMIFSNAEDATELGEDFIIGDAAEFLTGETDSPEDAAESPRETMEPLPVPPALPTRTRPAPLPEIPDLPTPVGRATSGRSLSARIAAGRTPGPVYPPESFRLAQTGTVVVQFTVDAAGRVTAASVYTSSNWSLLDREALRTVRTWSFPPGDVMTLIRPIYFRIP